MRFFTPELLKRYRSTDDVVADAASEEWDRAIDAYRRHVKDLRRKMSDSAKDAMRLPSLHDARLIGYLAAKGPLVIMIARLEGSKGVPGPILEYAYHTVGRDGRKGVSSTKHDAGETLPKKGLPYLLYDEFDLGETPDTFTHSILFSDGTVTRVRFRELTARLVEPLAVPGIQEAGSELSLAGAGS